jgi:hypothetical protein
VSANRVVEVDKPANVRPGIARGLVGLEVDLLIFDGSPESLDQDVVAPASLAGHADGDLVRLQHPDELQAGELATLIGIVNLRSAGPGDRFLQRLDAEVGVYRVGEPPGQDLSAVPVHHGHQKQESTTHRQVGDFERPDPIGSIDFQSAQQVRIDLVSRMTLGSVGLPVDRVDAHLLHQGGDLAPPDTRKAVAAQDVTQPSGACKRVAQVQAILRSHERQGRNPRPALAGSTPSIGQGPTVSSGG